MEIDESSDFIQNLMFFIDHQTKFDGSFVDSVIDLIREGKDISDAQYEALVNIYEKWRVKEFIEMKFGGPVRNFDVNKFKSRYDDEDCC